MIEKTHHGVIAFTKACYDYSQIYPPENPSVIRQFEFLLSTCLALIERDHGFNVEINANYLMVSGQYVEPKHINKSVIDWFVGHCLERKIHEVSFSDGLTKRELESFVQLFKTDARIFVNDSVACHILIPAGVEHIQINPQHLDDSFSAARPLSEPQADPIELTADAKTENRMFEPDLFISVDSGMSLRATVDEQLQHNEVWKVADFMANMRRHFASPKPEIQRLALSRYRIVLEAVVERGLDDVIHSVFKTFPQDLESITDEACLNIHMKSFSLLLDRYLKASFYPAVVFGLYALADNATKHPESEAQELLQQRLTPELLGDLLKAKSTNSRLDRNIKVLFNDAPLAISRALVHHLSVSEDKQDRRTVLNLLAAMGSNIHHELLRQLRLTLNSDEPWYLQRNILFVLAASPPHELAPILKEIMSNNMHRRVADQAYRCLFALNEPDLVEQGSRLMDGAKTGALSTFINIISSHQNDAYAPALIDLADRHTDDRIAAQAMAAVARIGGGTALTYLTGVLNESSILAKFKSKSRRVAAAQALLNSGHKTLLAALARFASDKDEQISLIAQKAKTML